MVEEKTKAKRMMDPGLTSGGCWPTENSPSPRGLGSGAVQRRMFSLHPGEGKIIRSVQVQFDVSARLG